MVYHRHVYWSVIYVLYDDMSGEAEPRTVPSRPGWSKETGDLRRGRGDDGWAGCNGGGARWEPPGQNGPSPVLPNGRPPGLLMHPPQGEGRRGKKGEEGLWEMDARRQLGVLSSNNGLVKDGQRSI